MDEQDYEGDDMDITSTTYPKEKVFFRKKSTEKAERKNHHSHKISQAYVEKCVSPLPFFLYF